MRKIESVITVISVFAKMTHCLSMSVWLRESLQPKNVHSSFIGYGWVTDPPRGILHTDMRERELAERIRHCGGHTNGELEYDQTR